MDELKDQIRISEHYLIIALHQSLDWIDKISIYPSTQANKFISFFNEINEKFPGINDVRNMKEHLIEYVEGEGRKQKKFVTELDNGNTVLDASSTIRNGNNYFVGSHIEVNKVLTHFKELFEELNEMYRDEFRNA